jgi:hypothetical protein
MGDLFTNEACETKPICNKKPKRNSIELRIEQLNNNKNINVNSQDSYAYKFCCDEKCLKFWNNHDQVDGMACKKCKSFSVCMCKCVNYKKDCFKYKCRKFFKTIFHKNSKN